MEESIKIILETVGRSKGELDTAIKQIQKLTEGTKQQASASEKANAIIQKHRNSFLALGLAAAAAQAAVVLLIKGQIQLGDTLNALSQKVGFSVESLSTLSKVAENANLEFGSFANGLKFFNKALVDSTDAGSESAVAFAALGFSQQEVAEGAKNGEKFLLQVADAFASYSDSATKTTVSSKIFGRDGFSWIPLLNQGAQGLKDQQAEIRALGGEMSGKFAKDADAFNDSLKNISTIIKGGAQQIIEFMLPALKSLADLVIANKNIVVPMFLALAAAVTLATTAFTAFKVLSFAAGVGKLALLLPGLAAQFGIVASATTAAGTAAGATTVAFAPLALAIGAVTAALVVGVVAWQAYNASVGEEKAVASLGEQTSKITALLQKQVDAAKNAGKLTVEEATKLQIALSRGQAGGVDSQIAGNKKVMEAIRGKTTEELKFNDAALTAGVSLAGQADKIKPDIVIPDTPEQAAAKKKVVSDRERSLTTSQAEGVGAEADILEAEASVDLSLETQARIAEITQLRLEEQSLQQFAATEELQAQYDQGLITLEEVEAQKTVITAQGELARLAIKKRGVDSEKAMNQVRVQAAITAFSDIATAAESQGKAGFIVAKTAATAGALIQTYLGATAAFTALAGIPYVGPVLGIIAAAAAVAAGLVNVAKINSVSFAEGGLVPGAPSATDNRMAAVATGEYIFDARSVAKLGPAYFAGLHDSIRSGSFTKGFARGGLVPRPVMGSSFASGGLVGQGDAAAAEANSMNVEVGFLDTRNRERDFMLKDGIKILIDQMQRRGNKVFA